jgi:hypothetical protein
MRLLQEESEVGRLILVPHLHWDSQIAGKSVVYKKKEKLTCCMDMQSCVVPFCLFDRKAWVFHRIYSSRLRNWNAPSELALSKE